MRKALKYHKSVHTGEKPYICKECGNSFTQLGNLNRHKIIHSGEKPHACAECGKSFSDLSSLKAHKRIHSGEKPFICKVCAKSFTHLSSLKKHERIHSGEKPYTCKVCAKSFTHLSSLKTHEKIHSGEKPFNCKVCAKSFTRLSSLKTHEKIHSGEKPYACTECGKSFTHLSSLTAHKRIHSGEKPFVCKVCGKSFTQLANLKMHERIHSGEKPYACTECGKSFSHLSSLKPHKRIHSGEKPFVCKVCGKSCTQLTNLKLHESIHSSEKPYACTICEKRFTHPRSLKRHQRIHSSEKPFLYKESGKSFSNNTNLKVHEKIHSAEKPFVCEECGKTFTLLGSLKTHKRIHSGERPYTCTECGKTFTLLGTLKRHKRIHLGKKPHTCTQCQKSFTRFSSLKVHERIHLRNNLSTENCISTVALSRLYDHHDIEDLAEKYILRNLGEIAQGESFSSISKDDVVRYVSAAKVDYKVLWQAVISWVRLKQDNRDQLLVELMEVVKIEAFPFQFLFEKIVSEDLVKNSKPARDRVIKAMFTREEVKSNLTVENVFTLRRLIQKSNLTEKDKMMKLIKDFMLENFEDLVEREDFVQLDEGVILMFLRSPETKCSSEEFKWEAMLKWTKFERRRKILFVKFFRLIRLERFTNEFIRNKIRIESLVTESTECMDLIVKAVCDRAESATAKVASTPCIAFLDYKEGGTVKVFDVNQKSFTILSRSDSADEIRWSNCGIVNCNGDIYVLVGQNLSKLDRDLNWIRLRSMPVKPGKYPKMIAFQDDIFVLAGSSIMARYKPVKNEWLTDLPGSGLNGGYCIASSETSLFALGGGRPTNEVKKFDPNIGSWTSLTPMLQKRAGASAAILHGLVVAGGYDGYRYLNSVEYFSHFSRSWSTLPNMNSCHGNFTLLTICEKLYVCGGDVDADTGQYKNEGTIEVYNENSAEWQTLKKEKTFYREFIACVYFPKK